MHWNPEVADKLKYARGMLEFSQESSERLFSLARLRVDFCTLRVFSITRLSSICIAGRTHRSSCWNSSPTPSLWGLPPRPSSFQTLTFSPSTPVTLVYSRPLRCFFSSPTTSRSLPWISWITSQDSEALSAWSATSPSLHGTWSRFQRCTPSVNSPSPWAY